eukprot:SAG31_NODE_3114_length_4659_cov_2.682745_1_plen_61_part_00
MHPDHNMAPHATLHGTLGLQTWMGSYAVVSTKGYVQATGLYAMAYATHATRHARYGPYLC